MSLRINSWIRQVGAVMLFGITCLCFAQGTIILNNRTPTGDVRIGAWDGSGLGSLPGGATAQLFLLTTNGQSTPLFPSTTFRTNPAAATYFVNAVEVAVPGYPAGSQVTIILRSWAGLEPFPPTSLFGESAPLTVTLGGETPAGEILPAATLAGLQSFTLLTPTIMYFTSILIQDQSIVFGIAIQAPIPRNYILETSENFTAWQPIATNPPSSFTIPHNPTNQNLRFFRLRMP